MLYLFCVLCECQELQRKLMHMNYLAIRIHESTINCQYTPKSVSHPILAAFRKSISTYFLSAYEKKLMLRSKYRHETSNFRRPWNPLLFDKVRYEYLSRMSNLRQVDSLILGFGFDFRMFR